MAKQFLIEIWVEPGKYTLRGVKSQDHVSINSLLAAIRQEIKAIEKIRTGGTH